MHKVKGGLSLQTLLWTLDQLVKNRFQAVGAWLEILEM